MPNYRLVFTDPADEIPIRSVSFSGGDPGEAFFLAQLHNGAAQLWLEDRFLCTLRRSGNERELWVISGTPPEARKQKGDSLRPDNLVQMRQGGALRTAG